QALVFCIHDSSLVLLSFPTRRSSDLPALRRYQNLTLGDYRRGEVEQQRRIAWSRHSDAERSRGEAPVGSAERRHEDAAGGIDEVDRNQPRFRRHLAPVADAADMAGVADGHDRDAVLLRLVDAELNRLPRDRLAEPELAVDDRQYIGGPNGLSRPIARA